MPLLTSPIDGSPMRQINRYGIEIDVCPTSGGIWLDKGELEKLMCLLQEEAASAQPDIQPAYRRERHDNDWDDDDHYSERHSSGMSRPRKKEGKMSRVMDLFDF